MKKRMDAQSPGLIRHHRFQASPGFGLVPAQSRDPALQVELVLKGGQGLDLVETAAQVGIALEQARAMEAVLFGLGHDRDDRMDVQLPFAGDSVFKFEGFGEVVSGVDEKNGEIEGQLPDHV